MDFSGLPLKPGALTLGVRTLGFVGAGRPVNFPRVGRRPAL